MRRKPKICQECWLVPDWRKAWKWFSVQILVLIAAAQGLLEFMPSVKDFITPSIWHGAMVGLAVLAIVGRLINQSKP